MIRIAASLFALVLATGVTAQTERPALTIIETEEYGSVLAGPDGKPVYTFQTQVRAGDGQTALESCNEPCRVDWPLVRAPDDPVVGEGLDPDLVATLDWEGQEVLVYNSHALFTFAHDPAATGDLAEPQGQANHSYGGWWYLLSPEGEAIVTGIAPDPDDPAALPAETADPS